jgi:hypothetical protein
MSGLTVRSSFEDTDFSILNLGDISLPRTNPSDTVSIGLTTPPLSGTPLPVTNPTLDNLVTPQFRNLITSEAPIPTGIDPLTGQTLHTLNSSDELTTPPRTARELTQDPSVRPDIIVSLNPAIGINSLTGTLKFTNLKAGTTVDLYISVVSFYKDGFNDVTPPQLIVTTKRNPETISVFGPIENYTREQAEALPFIIDGSTYFTNKVVSYTVVVSGSEEINAILNSDPIDQVFAAMGAFSFNAVPIATITKTKKGNHIVNVKGYYCYAIDVYDFRNRGKNFTTDQLGLWGKTNLVESGLKNAVIGALNPLDGLTRVTNGDFRNYRSETGNGMDYMLFTPDIKTFILKQPQRYLLTKGSKQLKKVKLGV